MYKILYNNYYQKLNDKTIMLTKIKDRTISLLKTRITINMFKNEQTINNNIIFKVENNFSDTSLLYN